jgi:hypothetical protein
MAMLLFRFMASSRRRAGPVYQTAKIDPDSREIYEKIGASRARPASTIGGTHEA